MNKIKDNPSYDKLRQDLQGAKALRTVFKAASIFTSKTKESIQLLDKMIGMEAELEHLASRPDRFNEHFSHLGWIAHESMNSDLMDETIKLADLGKINEAESLLIDYYCSEQTEWNVVWLKNIPAFLKRYELINYARKDTLEERYYACIPVLLMIIDGGVNDIDKTKGFFTEGADLTAWDSIAAHSTGLSVIRDLFNKSIKKTNSDQITVPYRNGILHGRELGYANRTVAAKCWATLFAIYDWATIIKNGKKNPPEPEKPKSFRELAQTHQDIKKMREQIDRWKPRVITIGTDIPETGNSDEYTPHTPEKSTIEFAEYWSRKNYGFIAKQLYLPFKDIGNLNEEIKNTRRILEDKNLIAYKIIKIDDQAPAICEVTMRIEFKYQGIAIKQDIVLRHICQREDGSTSMFGDEKGNWYFIDSFFYEIERRCFQEIINKSNE